MSTHFVLFLYIENETLRKSYEDKILAHNEKMTTIINGSCECYDAGIDLFCPRETICPAKNTTKINHEIKCSMMKYERCEQQGRYVGYYLYPRSSTGTKTPLRLANSAGIIDSGYRGDIISAFDNIRDEEFRVKRHQRLVQLCPPDLSYPTLMCLVDSVENLGDTRRGNRGFGSTGV